MKGDGSEKVLAIGFSIFTFQGTAVYPYEY